METNQFANLVLLEIAQRPALKASRTILVSYTIVPSIGSTQRKVVQPIFFQEYIEKLWLKYHLEIVLLLHL
jgi:hypothetical protein